MSERGFVQPIASALHALKRMPSLVVWAILIVVEIASRAMLRIILPDPSLSSLLMVEPVFAVVRALIGGVLTFYLARTLVAPNTRHARPLYGRFVGLFVASGLITWLISGIGRVVIFAGEPSQFMMTYGSILVGSFGAIVTFAFLVRMLTAAAGSLEPRLGGTLAFAFREGWSAYVWYTICAILFPVLMVYTFHNVLGPGNEANDLPGNFLQSVITGTGSVLQYLLAVVVARCTLPDARRLAETFA